MLDMYFKNEDRVRGDSLVRSVSLSGSSDTGVRAYVDKFKVLLLSSGIESATFTATCTCSNGKKGRLCAHTWAVLQKLEGSDFLSAKTEIEGASAPESDFRKQQAARQKEYLRKRRDEMKERDIKKQDATPARAFSYPGEVQEALAYFSANGFTFESLNLDALMYAKKLLSRVFHPDKGGTHEEVLELNSQFEVIADYLQR